ncbi:MAG TPA: protein-tyrosine phosphatase family protein [Steroidobacteraceae bacterium]|nr:protein-tyrosine phosphatase family protein [Steroidobacteraceae bacterium]
MTSGAPSCPPPLPNSYWITPGRLLGGEYPGGETAEDTRRRLELLAAAGVDCFVNLTRAGELAAYQAVLPPGTQYFHLPILDHGLPVDPDYMQRILGVLGVALAAGRCVYVHCRMGIGRTGTVLGCHLVEQGLSGEAALDALNRSWQQCARSRRWASIPETHDQRHYVASWQPRPARNMG